MPALRSGLFDCHKDRKKQPPSRAGCFSLSGLPVLEDVDHDRHEEGHALELVVLALELAVLLLELVHLDLQIGQFAP